MMHDTGHPHPSYPRFWTVTPGRVIGGCYPGDTNPTEADRKLSALLEAGVGQVICLQEEDERSRGGAAFVPYLDRMQSLAAQRGGSVVWHRKAIPDMGVPSRDTMREILDLIAAFPGVTFIHCWGGHGRTGTVAGCWLREQGMCAEDVLQHLRTMRRHDAHLAKNPCPQTAEQCEFVRRWSGRGHGASGRVKAPEDPVISAWWTPSDPAHDRPLGALLGLACGDALGTTLEFTRLGPQPWSPLLAGPHQQITGGGPFAVAPGQVTDDTQMACCLAASLVAHDGVFDGDDVARRYQAWSRAAFDIGGQTRAALAAFGASGDPMTSGLQVWRARGREVAGNGALMRGTPIAVFNLDQVSYDPDSPPPEGRIEATSLAEVRRWSAIHDARITHADPRCCLASAAFVAAVAAGIAGADAAAMHGVALTELPQAVAVLRQCMPADEHGHIAAAEAALAEDLRLAQADDPDLYGPIDLAGAAQGFVRVAFRLAFWELLHAPTWQAGVVDAVNRGGDADTNGAIVGALLGAHHGLAAIPQEWVQTVLECKPKPPWDGGWHPRGFVHTFSRSH